MITEEQIEKVLHRVLDAREAYNPEQTYSIPKTARKLGKSPHTVRRMIDEGTIGSCADGKCVSQEQINEYLKRHPRPKQVIKTTPDLPPHKKLVNVPPGYTAIIIPTENLEHVREAMETADTTDMVDYYEPIIENAKIITHQL